MDIEIKTDVIMAAPSPAAAIEALKNTASALDTLRFVPVGGKAIVLDRTVDLTSPLELHFEAEGAGLYSKFEGPCCTIGAPLGKSVGNLTWRGGFLEGGLVVQNANHSRIEPQKVYGSGQFCAGMELRTDGDAGYNFFHVAGGIANADIGFQITQLTPQAWVNFFRLMDTSFAEQADSGKVVTAIAVRSPTGVVPIYAPSLGVFDHIDVEGVGTLLDCPNSNVSFQFMNFCYSEGSIEAGTVGPNASICLDCS